MGRKKKPEEHVNLERWMVSYADFMTLLFATFVVLYALAQIDLKEFNKLEESIRSAFNNVLPIDGGQNVMEGVGENILSKGMNTDNDAVIPPMLEYLNPKYEKTAMQDIKSEIEDQLKEGLIKGVAADLTDRGLIITLNDMNAFFASGSAELTPEAIKTINNISEMIKKRFNRHLIRIEGHTDSLLPNPNGRYPSNWELSAARSASVARYMISRYSIPANLFTIIGYGSTKPLDTNDTPAGRSKNRRIEIVILKNQIAKYEPDGTELISTGKTVPKTAPKKTIKPGLSDAAQELLLNHDVGQEDIIILDEYNKPSSQNIKDAITDFEKGKIIERKKLNSKFH